MESFAKVLPNIKKFKEYIDDVSKGNFPINISGLTDSAKAHFIYATKYYTNKPVLVITYNEIEQKKLYSNLKFFEDEDVLVFPKKEVVYYDVDTTNKDNTMDRLSVYSKLYNSTTSIILTTIEAVMQKTISKTDLFNNVLFFEVGKEYNLEEVKLKLSIIGYERADICESRGTFAIRGGIIDVFPLTYDSPIRIEFWGDEIDSIRKYDAVSQRSFEPVQNVTIFPVEEFIVDPRDLPGISKAIQNDYKSVSEVSDDITNISTGNYLNKALKYFDYFFKKQSSLIDFVSKDTIIFIDEPQRIKSKAQSVEFENKEILEDYLNKYKVTHSYTEKMSSFSEIAILLEDINAINLFLIDENMHAKRNGYNFSCREVNFFRGNLDIFIQEIEEARQKDEKIVLIAGTISKCRTLATMLLDHSINCSIVENDESIEKALSDSSNKSIIIIQGHINSGYKFDELPILFVACDEESPLKEKKHKVTPKAFSEGKRVAFADLNVGDYIVHSTHGIGQYIGIHTLIIDKIRKDYIKIKYKDDDILYIPTNQLDSIRKYMSSNEDSKPRLNRLGSKDFEKTKARVRASVKDIAKQLIALYAERSKLKGFKFSKDTSWQNEFEDLFPYQETDDQIRCIEEVKKDMESERPMDRLLLGDVGYGKTEVAIRAAFKSVMDSKQVAYLCPTTVLAQQQYETFKDRMKDYPINVAVLNRFKTVKETKKIISDLASGKIDIIIGTHKILRKRCKI